MLHRIIVYTKSIGKFPKKAAHASFLLCSAYIVFVQNDDLGTTYQKKIGGIKKFGKVQNKNYFE